MQPPNKETIRNNGSKPIVDEIGKAFVKHAIYSIKELYSCYDKFQLPFESRNLTTMKIQIGLFQMYTLPQGASNSMAHMWNAMNQIPKKFVLEKTILFVDDIPIKGCEKAKIDYTIQNNGCNGFVNEHIKDVNNILSRLEEVDLTLSIEKSKFETNEIFVIRHQCGWHGRKHNLEKMDAIGKIKAYNNTTKVKRFLGTCVFYQIWIPHFAHISKVLYKLLRKKSKFLWKHEQDLAMEELKKTLKSPPILKQVAYECDRLVIVIVDTNPIAIRWCWPG